MRVILVVLDSVGIGELPDAAKYGDAGSNTLINIQKAVPEMRLPNLVSLGLSAIEGGSSLGEVTQPLGAYCKLAEASEGKDTTTGHWEIAGLVTAKGFPTYPNGFPKDVIDAFEKATGHKTMANCTASGTEIIQRLGDEHVKTGALIVYTSADSVFQVAAHEDLYPPEKLYEICQTARDLLQGEHGVSRVIARPFTGTSGAYTRTANRRDFSLPPTGPTMLDILKDAGQTVAAVGKIEDIFCGEGVTEAVHTKSNDDGVTQTLNYMHTVEKGLIFTNLVDFDMVYGHRNDAPGYANALMAFDQRLPEIMAAMQDEDVLMLTADHGCDPTTPSTDHSREHIPLLVYGKHIKPVNLGVRNSFADIAATILELFGLDNNLAGTSFCKEICK